MRQRQFRYSNCKCVAVRTQPNTVLRLRLDAGASVDELLLLGSLATREPLPVPSSNGASVVSPFRLKKASIPVEVPVSRTPDLDASGGALALLPAPAVFFVVLVVVLVETPLGLLLVVLVSVVVFTLDVLLAAPLGPWPASSSSSSISITSLAAARSLASRLRLLPAIAVGGAAPSSLGTSAEATGNGTVSTDGGAAERVETTLSGIGRCKLDPLVAEQSLAAAAGCIDTSTCNSEG